MPLGAPPEGHHLVPDPDHPRVRQEAKSVERDEGPDHVRMEGVLVVHASHRFPQETGKGLHLLMRDEVRALDSDRSGKGEFLGLAQRFPRRKAAVEPHGRPDEDVGEERLPRGECRYPGPGAGTSSPARIRIASITSKRSAASPAITFEIPGSRPMDTSAVRPAALKSSALANCAKIPGGAPGSEGPAAAMSR